MITLAASVAKSGYASESDRAQLGLLADILREITRPAIDPPHAPDPLAHAPSLAAIPPGTDEALALAETVLVRRVAAILATLPREVVAVAACRVGLTLVGMTLADLPTDQLPRAQDGAAAWLRAVTTPHAPLDEEPAP